MCLWYTPFTIPKEAPELGCLDIDVIGLFLLHIASYFLLTVILRTIEQFLNLLLLKSGQMFRILSQEGTQFRSETIRTQVRNGEGSQLNNSHLLQSRDHISKTI